MKLIVLVVVFLQVTTLNSDGAIGLLAYYPLDGNAIDATTNQFHGTIDYAPTASTNRQGLAAGALHFNGRNDNVDLGNQSAFNFAANFTISCWVKLTGPAVNNYVIGKGAAGFLSSSNSYGLGFMGSKPYAFISYPDAISGVGYVDVTGNVSLEDNTWHFLTLVYDRAFGLRLYVDQETTGEVAAPDAPPFTNSVALMIGNGLPGAIDDVRIYDRAVSGQEVMDLFATPAPLAIAQQPADAFIETGTNALFSVSVTGSEVTNANYQWFTNGVAVPDGTNATYTTVVQDITGRTRIDVRIRGGDLEFWSLPANLIVSKRDQLGLLAHWTFDEEFDGTIPDATGNYPGDNRGGVRGAGYIGSGALDLNGTSAYVYVGGQNTPIALTNSQYTITWWQKWNGPRTSEQSVLAMYDPGNYNGGYKTFIASPQGVLACLHSGGIDQTTTLSGGFADGIWRFYAVTYDGQWLRMYTDGVLVDSAERLFAIRQEGNDPLILGAAALPDGSISSYFNGSLDDIRIYERTLSEAEVRQLGPEPEIIIVRQPQSFRLPQGRTVTLRANITARGIPTTPPEFTYQWEREGTPIAGATNGSLMVQAQGGIEKYRLLIKARDLQVYTEEATVETVFPSGGNALLHLDFEENDHGRFYDQTNGIVALGTNVNLVPGRVGRYAAEFSGAGYIRVPAAGTDLEMVGVTSYTLAWWMKSNVDTNQLYYVFTIGPRDFAGYGVRLEGGRMSRSLRLDHRTGANSLMNSPYRATNWIHIAVVYEGGRRTVYQNGEPTNQVNTASTLAGSGQHDLFIGADELGNTYGFGLMDDLRIYNYALPVDDIRKLATAPFPAPWMEVEPLEENILFRWPRSEQKQYQVEYSAGLGTGTTWTPIEVPTETTAHFHRLVQPTTGQLRFYRLKEL